MEIIVASTAGFCFGVNKAINMVYDNLDKKPLYTYGPIIHNSQVVEELKKKNVLPINSIEDINKGTIVIRSHGVPKSIYENIKEKGLKYIDATCPYVKRIHKIVYEHSKKGYQIVIIGDRNHPEVKGIEGWSNNTAFIIENDRDIEKIGIKNDIPICLVSQTTYREDKFNDILKTFKNKNYKVEAFNTICKATFNRQQEAIKIAKTVNKMIVIGGKNSSNTKKLYEICKQYCNNTYHIETVKDLKLNNFKSNDKIGITAGASTPARIIKEVIAKMNDLQNTNNENFEELLNQSFISLRSGQIVKGTVINITDTEVSVNLGYKSDGIISKSEFSNDPTLNLQDVVNVGDEIEAYILRVNDMEGIVELSKKRVDTQKGLEIVKEAYENKTILKGKVIEIVKGGIIAISNEIKIFIPMSLIEERFVKDLNSFLGKTVEFKVIEFDKKRKRIIGDRKQILIEESNMKKQQLLNELEIGKKVKGIVSNITDFGAFVDLGGIDGLLHISQISWNRINKVDDVLKIGQEVEVEIIELDKEKEKIALSMKTEENNPWFKIEEKYPVDSVVKGKIVRLVPFGAFMELEPGVDGLIHVSQIANKYVNKPEDELKVGEIIEAKVLKIDPEHKKITLSKKQLEDNIS
ncbi:bifunctional 4-hydroxy-3-methylbut-2-enyl diphosphate reductase/30S ribosomal protein S1 [Defluviitalea phaphyphila]|uniref:bifunctional 4-hydroxy-3-methylbut-2-enyl diphosphate reductase/30S ribosomal protein S1 n=1 Tax=Defluviitalea phaphyphila TaxID=1473580 RepID=UPI00073153C3|nr:bifunctional 4-hydroxy-3-methylbut-2-enyl diphosphate reductase/30S ribosomal protein S1 [Defluviitalea phaphyphila]